MSEAQFADEGFNSPLRAALTGLKRHKLLATSVFLAGTLAAVVFTQVARPSYTAQTVLAVGPSQRDVLDESKQKTASEPMAIAAVWTEVTKLQSWTIAAKVIDRLDLASDPEINEELQPPGRFSPTPILAAAWEALALDDLIAMIRYRLPHQAALPVEAKVAPARAIPPELHIDPVRIRLIQSFQKHLEIQPDRLSNLINVRFTTHSAQRATWIVNDLVKTYLDDQVEAKYRATQRAVDWLTATIGRMHTTLSAAEDALEAYRSTARLGAEGSGGNLVSRQLSDINAEYAAAQSAEITAVARAAQLSALAVRPGALAGTPEVLASAQVQAIASERTRIAQAFIAAREQFGESHPTVARLSKQLADLDRALGEEGRRVAASARAAADMATTRRESLAARLGALQREANSLNQSEVHLRELQREVDANRAVYEPFLLKVKDLSAKLEVQQADATIVSPALAPLSPSFPRKVPVIGLSALGSLILGIVCALVADLRRKGLDSPEQVEQATGLPSFGMVPRVPASSHLAEVALGDRRAANIYREAIQGIRTGLDSRHGPPPLRTMLVTSSLPGEGKSTIAASIARLAALSGKRVILVDGDLFNPSLHVMLGASNGPGLADYLLGSATIADILQRDVLTPLCFITAGCPLERPSDQSGSVAMRNLLDLLAIKADLVIIDGSPVLAVAGARRLAPLVDQCVLVVGWRRASAHGARTAVRLLRQTGARIGGSILSMVDMETYLLSVTGGDRDGLRYLRQRLPKGRA